MVVAYACRKRANTNYLMHIKNSLKLALIITDVNLGIHGVFKIPLHSMVSSANKQVNTFQCSLMIFYH